MDLDKDIGSIDLAILDLVAKRIDLLKQKMAGKAGANQDWSLASHCGKSLRDSIEASDRAMHSLAERVVPFLAGVSHQSAHEPVRIAYLGPEFSYSYSAARNYFGSTDGFQAVQTIGAVFEEIERGQSTYGVVPIENSTDGRIVDTLTMFIRHPVRICGEVLLPIHHNLLAKCDRSEIKEVYSKPQALSQCRAWLAEHLPGARWVEVASTAVAAQIATHTVGAAAVASRDAGIALGLDLVAESIEDNKNNITRFAIIGGDEPKPTLNDKTSLMFQVPHKPGALADVMLLFRDNGLNLTWIESFPVPGVANEYFFFVELDGHRTQPNVDKAIRSLEQSALRLNFLGSYPKGRLVG
ncbi:MAG: prephenate dehydratase [Pirellula sp.]|nr:prephenate dehydratase [Pirellula sp.]